MKDLLALPYVHAFRKGGRLYVYLRRSGERIRLPDPADREAFLAAYGAALRGRRPIPKGRTFTALIARYKASDRYLTKAPRTRSDYDKVLAMLADKIGPHPVADMDRPTVLKMQSDLSATVRKANYAVQVTSIILDHAIDLGWRTDNPAKGVRLIQKRGPDVNRPWTAEARAAFEARATPLARLAYELGICTGQRVGDLLRMKWDDIVDDGIHVAQGKTGAELWIPFTNRLRAHLSAVERRGVHILARDLRRPVTYRQLARAVALARKGTAAEGFTIHGWRYTCAADMAALGKSDDQIAAITGHQSIAMIRKYAGPERQKARARKAQEGRG